MAQFDPSRVLRRVPQRRNTLIDFSPVSLPDLETPSTGALVAALANDSMRLYENKINIVKNNLELNEARLKIKLTEMKIKKLWVYLRM